MTAQPAEPVHSGETWRHGVRVFSRAEFIDQYFDYRPGEHVTFLAPSGNGKTQLAFQLLGSVAHPELQATVFVMKPKDATVTRFAVRYKFRTVRSWPPPRLGGIWSAMDKKPNGYLLWPVESDNPDLDDIRHKAIFQRALRQMYRAGKRKASIIFADETYSLEQEMGLGRDLNRIWTKGRSNDVGLWAASQRPAFISQWAYQANHIFIGNDPDKRARDRYAEIGGGNNPELIKSVTASLDPDKYEFLYIHRDSRSMAIIEGK